MAVPRRQDFDKFAFGRRDAFNGIEVLDMSITDVGDDA